MNLYDVTAQKDFSSTIFGNVSKGDILKVSGERRKSWVEQGLVIGEVIDLSKMSREELIDFAQERFNTKLDKRRKVEQLREDVQAMLEVLG